MQFHQLYSKTLLNRSTGLHPNFAPKQSCTSVGDASKFACSHRIRPPPKEHVYQRWRTCLASRCSWSTLTSSSIFLNTVIQRHAATPWSEACAALLWGTEQPAYQKFSSHPCNVQRMTSCCVWGWPWCGINGSLEPLMKTQQSKFHPKSWQVWNFEACQHNKNSWNKLLCVFFWDPPWNPTRLIHLQRARPIPRVHCKCGVIVLHSNYLHCSVVKPRRTCPPAWDR